MGNLRNDDGDVNKNGKKAIGNKALSTRIRFCLKAEIFSPFLPTLHNYHVKTVTENAFFQKFSPEWRFLKTPASRLRVDGRELSYFYLFNVFVCTGENDLFEHASVDEYFLTKTEKKNICFQKYLATC